MFGFFWNPWHTPTPSGVAYGRCFPVLVGPVGAPEEARATARENGGQLVYIPVYMGWM